MDGRCPSYPEYKPSGVDWLGEIPAHWDVRRLKFVASVVYSNVDKHSKEDELPVRLCNYVDVYKNERITGNLDFMEATAGLDEIRKFALRKGDVIITKDSEEWQDIAVPALVDEDLRNVICGYHLALIRAYRGSVDSRYLFRSFQAAAINYQFQVAASGITRYGLGKQSLGDALFLLPPLPEQRAIAEYLDRETAHIDALIAHKRDLLDLLERQRAALISHAVTRGLNPNVPLKPSGVDWLGEIPAHWDVRRLKSITAFSINGAWGDEPKGDENDLFCIRVADFDYENLGVSADNLTVRNIPAPMQAGRLLDTGDLLVEKSGGGDIWSVGRVVSYTLTEKAVSSNFIARLVVNRNVDERFVCYLFAAMYAGGLNVRSIKQTTGIQNLDLYSYLNERFGLPPLPEQRAIAAYLDRQTARIDRLKAEIESSIELLGRYRTALISAAVTGKIRVIEDVENVENVER